MIYKYHCRPGYGSAELLLEFISGAEEKAFLPDLLEAVAVLKPFVKDINGLWACDELTMQFDSDAGKFLLSKDMWGFAFIMSTDNQAVISNIDNLLSVHPKFGKVAVDPERYKL